MLYFIIDKEMVKIKRIYLNKKDKWFSLANKKEQQESSSKPVNYTLFNQKIKFEFLKAHLWSAADYHHPVMILLFLKRLNATFEENAEKHACNMIIRV